MRYELITVLGPTASGKTALATALAYELDAEVISADSRQVYRGMTLGTGKDLREYEVKGKSIPYHLIDICNPGEKYNIFEFQRDFHTVFESLKEKGKLPILCGGSGLYIESVLSGYKLLDVPENHEIRESLKDKTLDELEKILLSEFQMPLYIKLYEKEAGSRREDSARVKGAYFYSINGKRIKTVMGESAGGRTSALSRDEYSAVLDAAEKQIEEFGKKVKALDFIPREVKFADCFDCMYKTACRKTYNLNS
jgi:hypothetical protein